MLIAPALELIATEPVESIVMPPLPALTTTAIALPSNFVVDELPTLIVLADAPEPILIFCASILLPILIAPPLELIDTALVACIIISPPLELIDTSPVPSTLTVVAPLIAVAPVPFIEINAVPSVIFNESTDVTVIAFAFTFTAVDAALPTWIVLAEAPEPILIF